MIQPCHLGDEIESALAKICGARFNIDELPSVWTFQSNVEWAVDGLVPMGGLTLVTGDSGVGKSTLALLFRSSRARAAIPRLRYAPDARIVRRRRESGWRFP